MNIKKYLIQLACMFAAVLVFTFLDYLVHQSSDFLTVPSWYFRNKIIYGTIYVFLISLFVRTLKIHWQALLISFITITLLQIRYYLIGYPSLFHLIIYSEHLIFLFVSSYGALYLLENKFKKNKMNFIQN